MIFTERIKTLRILEENLHGDPNLKPEHVAVVHGSGIEDDDAQHTLEDFVGDRPALLLELATPKVRELCGKVRTASEERMSGELIPPESDVLLSTSPTRPAADHPGVDRPPQLGYPPTE